MHKITNIVNHKIKEIINTGTNKIQEIRKCRKS